MKLTITIELEIPESGVDDYTAELLEQELASTAEIKLGLDAEDGRRLLGVTSKWTTDTKEIST